MQCKRSSFDLTVFKKTVLRFWPVWAAYSVIWSVAMPLAALMMLQLDANGRPESGYGHLLGFAQSAVPELHEMSLLLAAVFGVLAAMAVCSHLYNSKSANFFGALPIRREGLFLSHYLAGLSFLIVPSAAIFLLTLAIEAMGGAVCLPELLFWLGVTCGECFFFYSMAVFCGMFTGHILALPAFYGIFNALAYVLHWLIYWTFQGFYYGFAGFPGAVSEAVAWLTPVLKLARSVGVSSPMVVVDGEVMPVSFEGLDVVAVYAAAAVVLTIGSFLLYRARRLESAGDVVSVRPMRPVFKYSVAVCSGLCFGTLTAEIVYMHEPGLMASILVWAAAGYFVAQMLLDKSFRVFRKWKGAAAVCGAFIVLFLVVGFDLTGFENRVPTVDQVESVEFSGASLHSLGDDADYLGTVESDPDFIRLAILLHQTAIDQRDQDYGGKTYSRLSLTYHLKDGSAFSRAYSLWVDTALVEQEGSAAWAVQQIYDDRDLYWRAYGFDEGDRRLAEEDWRLEQVSYENDYYAEFLYYYGRDAEALYAAVKEDFLAGRTGVRTVGGEDQWGEGLRTLNFRFAGGEGGNWRYNIRICVQDSASSTLAVLERLAEEEAGQTSAPYTMTEGAAGMEPVPADMPADGAAQYPTVSLSPEHD